MFGACLCAAHAAYAQSALTDPTRPPSGLDGSTMAANAGSLPQEGVLVLQSVLISPQRRLAVISGETVKLGTRIGSAEVVRIEETEVTLREGRELHKLKLFAGVVKQPVGAVAESKDRSKKQR